jgi:murein DD-endopeptidase MepM/ murein hydrolase activator NlpD
MLTSAWHLSSLRRDEKATIRVPLAAVRENSAVQSPNPQEFGRMTWTLARVYVVCLRFAQVIKRSKRAAAGLAVAILVAASLGLSIPFAGMGPEAPPLADLEAPLGGPQDRGPHGTDLASQTTSAAGVAGQSQTHGPAGRIALAVEAAPAAVNRLVEVRRGDTLMNLLVDAGLERNEAYGAIAALSEVFSPRKLRAGQVIRLAMLADGSGAEVLSDGQQAETLRLISLALTPNPEEDVLVARQADDSFAARVEARPLTPRLSAYSGTIESSLFEAARDEGMPVETVVELIRLFSFDVDFQREIQQGDRFELLYDSFYDRAGELAKTGPLKYASMVLSGKRLEFYRFVLPDGSDDHFDANGRSVRRALLKTPVDGARISSGFGMRKHPIQGYNKMHRGVDFAAPRGTPVYAAGKGVIDRIGRNGGYGKYVRIRHNSTYKTAYAHMKSYAKGMKRGDRVKQGQVIGYVGSTGNSTGPHLHYEVMVDNKQVNPRKIKLPSGKSLKGADLEAFQQVRAEIDRLRGQSLPDLQMVQGGCDSDLPITPAASDNAAGTAAGAETC